MDYSLSNFEIEKYLRNTKIVPYSDIRKYYSAKDLVAPYNECVILYKCGESYGHWCCLLKNKSGYEFFDSYGIMLDNELEYPTEFETEQESEMFKHKHGQDYRYLTKLLSEVNQPVSYNHHKFQKFKRDDGVKPSTCGRHVILRLLNKKLSLPEFKKQFDQTVSEGTDYDETVCRLIKI